jgi:hypothetical protein
MTRSLLLTFSLLTYASTVLAAPGDVAVGARISGDTSDAEADQLAARITLETGRAAEVVRDASGRLEAVVVPIPQGDPAGLAIAAGAVAQSSGVGTISIQVNSPWDFEAAFLEVSAMPGAILDLRTDVDFAVLYDPATRRSGPLAASFAGRMAGNGHTLSNWRADAPLVGHLVPGAAFSNFTFAGADVSGAGGELALIAGRMDASTITDVHVSGRLSGVGRVAGIVASAWDGRIERCSADVTIHASGSNGLVGGIAGGIEGWGGHGIFDSYATGSITGGSWDVGGIAGSTVYNVYISSCYFSGTVQGSGRTVGGLCGYVYGHLENSYVRGTVSGPAGRTGWIGGDGTGSAGSGITNCWAEGSGSLVGHPYNVPISNSGFASLAEIHDLVIAGWSSLVWEKDSTEANDPVLK